MASEQKMVEQAYIAAIQKQFEPFGFAPIETRAAEPLDQLLQKGETDKEILAASSSGGGRRDLLRPALRLDGSPRAICRPEPINLAFPFKRYQIQFCGERPQVGRYREFDKRISMDRPGSFPVFDAEMPLLLHKVMGVCRCQSSH